MANFTHFQTERDNNFKFDQNGIKFSKRVEDTVRKYSFSHRERKVLVIIFKCLSTTEGKLVNVVNKNCSM